LGDGLPQIAICAEGGGQPWLIEDGTDDHRDMSGGRIGFEPLQDLPAILTGQHYIQQNQGWREVLEHFEGLRGVFCSNDF
jgi:hypothetical protein